VMVASIYLLRRVDPITSDHGISEDTTIKS